MVVGIVLHINNGTDLEIYNHRNNDMFYRLYNIATPV